MPNVKIGNKTIAFPSDMKDRDLEKAIRKLRLDFAVNAVKDFKPTKPSTFKKAEGGMMNKNLKPVDKANNPGLAKLPTGVRNKMGYMKDGGMVLEVGLRPATKKEMKMAKGMKKPKKMANGGMARGTGAAIRGKGFQGVF